MQRHWQRWLPQARKRWDHVKLYVMKPLSGGRPAEAPAVRKDWRKFGASPTQDVRLILYSSALLVFTNFATGDVTQGTAQGTNYYMATY